MAIRRDEAQGRKEGERGSWTETCARDERLSQLIARGGRERREGGTVIGRREMPAVMRREGGVRNGSECCGSRGERERKEQPACKGRGARESIGARIVSRGKETDSRSVKIEGPRGSETRRRSYPLIVIAFIYPTTNANLMACLPSLFARFKT